MVRLYLLSAAVFCVLTASVNALTEKSLPGAWELEFGAASCPAMMTIDRQAVLTMKGLQCAPNSTQLGLHEQTEEEGNQLTAHLAGGKAAADRVNTKGFGEIFLATVDQSIDCVNGTTPFKSTKGEILNFFKPVETTVIIFSREFAKPAAGAGHSEEEGHGSGSGHNLVAAVREYLARTARLTVEPGAKKNGTAGHSDAAGHSAGGAHNGTAGGHSEGGSHSHTPPPCGVACQSQGGKPVSGADPAAVETAAVGLRVGDSTQLKGGVSYMAFGSECLYKQTSAASCFPADAQVTLHDGNTVHMSDVKVGDEVSVGNGKFSRVFFWTHHDKNIKSEFVRLTTESGHSMEASYGHYVYANNKMVAAGTVRIGDAIPLSSGSSSKVVDVSIVAKTGLFNPQTLSGDIAVNGIVASTYTEAVEPKLAHALLTPLRMVTRTIEGALSMKQTA